MCLAQGPQRSDAGEARTRYPSVSMLKFCNTTLLPNSMLNNYLLPVSTNKYLLDTKNLFQRGIIFVLLSTC